MEGCSTDPSPYMSALKIVNSLAPSCTFQYDGCDKSVSENNAMRLIPISSTRFTKPFSETAIKQNWSDFFVFRFRCMIRAHCTAQMRSHICKHIKRCGNCGLIVAIRVDDAIRYCFLHRMY